MREVSLISFPRLAACVLAVVLFCLPAARAQDTKADDKGGTKSDEVYTSGGDVKPPKVVHYVEPDFSASSQEAYVEGVVRLSAIVDAEGLPTNLKVVRGLNAEEDKTAVAALKQWRFKPGTKSGQAVRVKITVEINFHLL